MFEKSFEKHTTVTDERAERIKVRADLEKKIDDLAEARQAAALDGDLSSYKELSKSLEDLQTELYVTKNSPDHTEALRAEALAAWREDVKEYNKKLAARLDRYSKKKEELFELLCEILEGQNAALQARDYCLQGENVEDGLQLFPSNDLEELFFFRTEETRAGLRYWIYTLLNGNKCHERNDSQVHWVAKALAAQTTCNRKSVF